jgi:DNA-binding YbaB/EbfC family protein
MMNNMADMFGKIQEMQTKMAEMKAKLGEMQVTADAGGGMVKVTANGNKEVISISIDPSLVTADDVEMLEDLTVAAVNKALREAEKAGQQKMAELTTGMFPGGLPGMDPSKFGL